jgi:hypothetical protein
VRAMFTPPLPLATYPMGTGSWALAGIVSGRVLRVVGSGIAMDNLLIMKMPGRTNAQAGLVAIPKRRG